MLIEKQSLLHPASSDKISDDSANSAIICCCSGNICLKYSVMNRMTDIYSILFENSALRLYGYANRVHKYLQ